MILNSDDLTGSTIVIPLVHERVHAGKTFQASYKSPNGSEVADDDAVDILFKNGSLPVHFTFSASAGGNIELLFYEAPTVSNNGSSLNVVGLNRHRSHSPKATVFQAPTVTAVGDTLFNGFDSRGVGLTGPISREQTEWVLKINTDYLIRIINRAGGARDIAIALQWYQAL